MTDFLSLLTQFSGLSAELLWASALVFLRVGAAMALLPAFGEQAVPQRLRLVLAVAFTAVVAPAVWSKVPQDGFALPMLVEIVAGLAIGIGLRLFVLALQTGAMMIAQATSLSQLIGGVGPEPQPAIGHLLVMAGLALAVMMGLHVRIAALLILSYDALPPGDFPGSADFARWGTAQTARAFSLAFTLAAPFTIAALLYNLALGTINRAMPALMVSLVGAPALALGGLVLLALVAPLALQIWISALSGFLTAPFAAPP